MKTLKEFLNEGSLATDTTKTKLSKLSAKSKFKSGL